jgi:hypothetical protein
MARIRTIKPEFFTSEDIVSLTPLARLLYIALWCESDREGRMAWKPKTFKMRYFPGDSFNVDELCNELLDASLVVRYGDKYAYIPAFHAHQHINPRESATQIPAPDIDASTTRAPRVSTRANLDMNSANQDMHAQVGREGKGREGVTSRGSRLPNDFEPDIQFAISEGIQNPKEEVNKFSDYWKAQPGQKGVKLDWPATWRNWCRNARQPVGRFQSAEQNSTAYVMAGAI